MYILYICTGTRGKNVHIILGYIIEPKFFGKTFNLHPVTIIIALMSWGMIWGITGLLLAAPLTAIIRILFEQSDTTKPIALLLCEKLHLKNYAKIIQKRFQKFVLNKSDSKQIQIDSK